MVWWEGDPVSPSLVSGTRGLTDAVLQVSSELEASVADTLETPLCVDAAAIATHHPVHHALVDV